MAERERAELTILQSGEETTIPFRGRFVVGSTPGANLVLPAPRVGPAQVVIQAGEEGPLLFVRGEGGVRVLVNGAPAGRTYQLAHGDAVELEGLATLIYREPGRRPATGTLERVLAESGVEPEVCLRLEDEEPLSWLQSDAPADRRLAMLHDLARLCGSATSENALLDAALSVALRGLDASQGLVLGLGAGQQLVELFARGAPGPLDEGPLWEAVERRRGVTFEAHDGRRCLVVPVLPGPRERAEQALGLTRPRGAAPFAREELELAASVGRQLGVALERVRLSKRLRERSLELERLQRRLEAVLGTIGEGLLLVTQDGAVAPLNERGRRLLDRVHRCRPGEPLPAGSPLAPLVARALSGELVDLTELATERHLLAVSGRRVASLEAAVLVLRDVTAERRREQRFAAAEQDLRQELLEVSAREQRRIGQDLHDGLCQTLAAALLLLKPIGDGLRAQGLREAERVVEVAGVLHEATRTARNLARGLCPVALEGEGLRAALVELAAATEKVYGVACALDAPRELLVHDHVAATHIYYVAHEAATNAARHAGAAHVRIALREQEDQLQLSVEDDGRGFDAEVPRAGMGLRIMRHRARSLGGELEVRSRPGEGTRVACTVPLAAPAAEAPASGAATADAPQQVRGATPE